MRGVPSLVADRVLEGRNVCSVKSITVATKWTGSCPTALRYLPIEIKLEGRSFTFRVFVCVRQPSIRQTTTTTTVIVAIFGPAPDL